MKIRDWMNNSSELPFANLVCSIEGDDDASDAGGDNSAGGAPDAGNAGDAPAADSSTSVGDPGRAPRTRQTKEKTEDGETASSVAVRDPKKPSAEWVAEIRAKGGKARLTTDEIQALANFKQPKKEKAPVEDPNQTPQAKPKAPAKAKAPATPAAQTPPAESQPADLGEIFKQFLETQAGNNKPAPKTEAPKDTPAAPKAWFGKKGETGIEDAMSVPPQILEAIDSEVPETRQAGINALINGVGNTIMDKVLNQILPAFEQHVTQQAMAQFVQRNAAKANNRAFYGAHPDLNQKEFYPIVDQVGRFVAAAWQKAGKSPMNEDHEFSEEFMAEVANTFRARMAQALGQTPPANVISQQTPGQSGATPVQTTKPPGRQPYIAERRARPPAASSRDQKSAAISDIVLF